MSDRICVVAGVGPGNGTAFTQKFAAGGYRVAMWARSEDRLRSLEKLHVRAHAEYFIANSVKTEVRVEAVVG